MGSAFYIYSPAVPLSPSIAEPTVGDETYPLVCLTDMVGDAQARLISEYGKSVRLRELAAIYVEQAQELEDALCTLMSTRDIETATGQYLDDIGTFLDFPRNGLPDADYRPFLRARQAALRSGGRPEDLLTVARWLIPDAGTVFELIEHFPFIIRLVVTGDGLGTLPAQTLFNLLRQAKAQGVRLHLEWNPSPDADTFTLAPTLGVVVTSTLLGLADFPVTTGGHLAGVIGA